MKKCQTLIFQRLFQNLIISITFWVTLSSNVANKLNHTVLRDTFIQLLSSPGTCLYFCPDMVCSQNSVRCLGWPCNCMSLNYIRIQLSLEVILWFSIASLLYPVVVALAMYLWALTILKPDLMSSLTSTLSSCHMVVNAVNTWSLMVVILVIRDPS